MIKIKKINWHSIIDTFFLIAIGILIWWGLMLCKQNIVVSRLINVRESKFSKFSAIDDLLKSEFYDQDVLNDSYNKMIDWALAWYVESLNDPYTVYLKEEENAALTNELKEEAWFAWIWAVVEKKDDYALISEVLKKSPAAKAWLLPLDRIYMVDDQVVKDLDINEVVSLIRWEKNTEVNLLIRRNWKVWWEPSQFSIPITRDDVELPSVSSELISLWDKNILYLEISIIASHTTSLLLEDVKDAMNQVEKIDGLILDLRWNSWWYLEEAVKLLWHFFPKWTLLVKSKYTAYEDIDHFSEWRWELWDIPTVLVVDQLTASAGEIIALAFQESWKLLIWMQTFWKWTIQSVEKFTDWSSLKYTIWKRYSPTDVNIDKLGITPDIEIPWDYEAYNENATDNQLEKAKEEILKLIL